MEPGDTVFDAKLCIPADVNGDNSLNIGDMSRIYAHIRGTGRLQDAYVLLCADYNGDGTINIGDAVKLYGFLRQT